MNVNERIARGLGFDIEAKAEHQLTTLIGDHNIEWCERCCSSVNTCCGGEIADVGPCEPVWPDYEHSLDALLEPLGVLRERGWELSIDTSLHSVTVWHFDMKRRFRYGFKMLEQMVEKTALAVADALEGTLP